MMNIDYVRQTSVMLIVETKIARMLRCAHAYEQAHLSEFNSTNSTENNAML